MMMKTAIGTKVIRFEPMTLNEFAEKFNKHHMNQSDEDAIGYHVQYDNPDGSVYDSWSPKDVFEAAYTCTEDGMSFGYALFFLGQGKKVARKWWNGKGMFLQAQIPDSGSKMTFPYLYMTIPECTEGTRLLPWQPAQVDIFSKYWCIVD